MKKREGFDRTKMAAYRLRVEEHRSLMAYLPTSKPRVVEQQGEQGTSTAKKDTIDLTVD